ncbi:MAG: hypothetical protein M3Z08_02790 [Chloroflexota bacterium]|nr:hypothetical protein [Chloroflexota bacterium]
MMKSRNPYEAQTYKQQHDSQVVTENNYLQEAKYELEQIYNNIHDAITSWYPAIVGQIVIYKDEIAWAAATGEVTVGELLQDLIHAPNGSPVVIYQTHNGGLVVAVNTFNDGLSDQQNAALLKQAIANYEQTHGIKDPQVTILGYQGGNNIVQTMMTQSNLPFHVQNVVLVGAQITQVPAVGTNYIDFVAPGDANAGDRQGSIIPQSPADWAGLAIDAGEIVVGGVTGGGWGALGAAGEVVVSWAAPVALTKDNNVNFANPDGYYNTIPPIGPDQVIGQRTLAAVPEEPGEATFGWKRSLQWPFFYGKTIRYDQSTFLNAMGLPDPNQQGGQTLAGNEPISTPTYYKFS